MVSYIKGGTQAKSISEQYPEANIWVQNDEKGKLQSLYVSLYTPVLLYTLILCELLLRLRYFLIVLFVL